ncbi:hypothetical protein EGW08_003643 [Elysia chlorotica]|uniref:Uncharacterized protein n=1 Tax=Elysia chlorotica TaxID=188477 RepID=A0A3S0ZWT4_ELYCH|nr:hypothetical protein EGW08_003643 [Elysia chlorotica]
MPSVKQTLATEQRKLAHVGSLGFHSISKHRLATIQQLFLEREACSSHKFLRESTNNTKSSMRSMQPVPQKNQRKGFLESQQYIILLDATTRRSKQIDEKARFAVTQEVLREEQARRHIEEAKKVDSDLCLMNRDHLQKSKAKDKKKRLELKLSRKSDVPKSISGTSGSSTGSTTML